MKTNSKIKREKNCQSWAEIEDEKKWENVEKSLTLCWTETAQVKKPSSSSIPSFAGGKPVPTVGGISENLCI